MRRRTVLIFGLCCALVGLAAVPADATAPVPTVLARKHLKADLLKSPKVSADVKNLIKNYSGADGGLDTQSASYGDLTGDGRADVVVPVYSGGTAGDIAYYVLAVLNGHVHVIRAVNDTYKVGAHISAHKLYVVTPDYRGNDPNCCPSYLTTTTFAWNGTKLVQVAKRTSKPTPDPGPPAA